MQRDDAADSGFFKPVKGCHIAKKTDLDGTGTDIALKIRINVSQRIEVPAGGSIRFGKIFAQLDGLSETAVIAIHEMRLYEQADADGARH